MLSNKILNSEFKIEVPDGLPWVSFRDPQVGVSNLISNTISIMVSVAALAVIFFLVWGALDWIIAGGDKDKIASARKKISNTLIGLFLLALTGFILILAEEITGVKLINSPISLPSLGDTP